MSAGFVIRRLLVALDLSSAARSTLPEALRLATRLHAEAEGLFVEDSRVMSAFAGQGLPSRHVSMVTGLPETLDAGAMDAALRAQSAMLSRHVSATATALRCRCELRTVRGSVAETLVSETDQDDLLVLSRRPGHVGATLAATVRRMSAPVLVLPPGESIGQGRIVVIADSAGFLARGLEAAKRFANESDRPVEILLGPGVGTAEADLLSQASGLPVRITAAADGDADVSQRIRSDTGLVIVSPENAALAGPKLTAFLVAARMPVLLMR